MPVTFACIIGQAISGRDCPDCPPGGHKLFSGLKLTYENRRALFVSRPYEVRTRTASVVLAWGKNTVEVALIDTDFATLDDLTEAVGSCNYVTGSTAFTPLGIYDSDAEAAGGGVAIGQPYELSISNIYGHAEGSIKIRRE